MSELKHTQCKNCGGIIGEGVWAPTLDYCRCPIAWREPLVAFYRNQKEEERNSTLSFPMPARHASLYTSSIDPYEKRLNWFQRQLKKIGFYKPKQSKVYIFKHNEDGTMENVTPPEK